ncbi:hypothetical protein K435DRAFT_836020 [Dendrothele bispora CBS 962.96]|uniref:Uncharacterized protein n=1 Tax=Dendrothele bispora (strain CBS 962.96) TaxID=1314807 RepID=A0A4S8MJY6_DENBC|nr:hypothetical protein K435DRAFT_836020 [Dendrothele bispora CBS 962.96]
MKTKRHESDDMLDVQRILDPLLMHNEPPSHLDTFHLRQSQDTLVAELSSSTCSRNNEVKQRLHRLENLLQEHRTVLSPMRRLPTEILSYIFLLLQHSLGPRFGHNVDARLFALESREGSPDVDKKGPFCIRGLRGLMKVCMRWRRVVLGTSSLWSRFQLHVGELDTSPQTIRRYRKTFEDCLMRASGQPLEFSFLASGQGELEDMFRQALLSRAKQWRRVWWESDTESFWSTLGKLPMLEELIFAAPSPVQADNALLSEDNAPRLKRVQFLISGGDELPVSFLQLPWSKLTHYRNFHADYELLLVVKSSPLLQSLHYSAHRSGSLHYPLGLIFRHEQLQHFTYVIWSPNAPAVLRYLRLPSLEVLKVGGSNQTDSPSFLPELSSFLHSSSCRLTTLHLARTHGREELIALLTTPEISRNLTELGLSLTDINMDFAWGFSDLLRIIPTDYSQTEGNERSMDSRLPKLEALFFKLTFERHFRLLPLAHLLEAVRSRVVKKHHPLQNLVSSIDAFEFRTGEEWGDIDVQIHGLHTFSYLQTSMALKVDTQMVKFGTRDFSLDFF